MKGIDLDHPANAGVLHYFQRSWKSTLPPSVSPDSVSDPYYNLGTHPDLVEQLWDNVTKKLTQDCRWVVYGRPALVHPTTGIVFAFASGTHTYALRLPEPERQAALRAGATRTHTYTDGSTFDLSDVGEEWVFGGWLKGEEDWCLAAYQFAGVKGG